MSQLIQIVDDRLPLPEPRLSNLRDVARAFRPLRSPLKLLATLLLAPLLFIVAVFGFLLALADFALFRLNDLRAGHPHPKGVWEF